MLISDWDHAACTTRDGRYGVRALLLPAFYAHGRYYQSQPSFLLSPRAIRIDFNAALQKANTKKFQKLSLINPLLYLDFFPLTFWYEFSQITGI